MRTILRTSDQIKIIETWDSITVTNQWCSDKDQVTVLKISDQITILETRDLITGTETGFSDKN